LGILQIYMSKIQPLTRISTLVLRQRKSRLLRTFQLPQEILHASLVERYMKCGKANCHCHTAGPKHGPFFYLNRCFAKGQMQSLLLKTPDQVDQARHSLAAYAQVQERLDQISQINHELLRRGEPLIADAS
jgi:histone acetyltransferase (RNA polymerase elongator complex component)